MYVRCETAISAIFVVYRYIGTRHAYRSRAGTAPSRVCFARHIPHPHPPPTSATRPKQRDDRWTENLERRHISHILHIPTSVHTLHSYLSAYVAHTAYSREQSKYAKKKGMRDRVKRALIGVGHRSIDRIGRRSGCRTQHLHGDHATYRATHATRQPSRLRHWPDEV